MSKSYKEILPQIKAFVLDIDGVMTDGGLTIMPDGELLRTMNVKDGYAMQLAIKRGFKIFVISGGKNESVRLRLNGLGITDVVLGTHEKLEKIREFLDMYDMKMEELLYMGDDIPDLEAMNAVGLATCPNDAVPEIRNISDYISPFKGGKGCVRDIIEQTLKVQNCWLEESHQSYIA